MAAFGLLLLPATEASAQTALKYLSEPASGQTVRAWDCCKPSGAWPGKADVSTPVKACAKDGVTAVSATMQSGCAGGSSYACNNNQPWAVNANMSYGFARANLPGRPESDTSCACYALQFTSSAVKGKTHVVQLIGQGPDIGANVFELLIPGGGVGLFNGCQSQWGAPSTGWGDQYGGVRSKAECSQLPSQLRAGCNWRFDWFLNADNPSVSFRRVKCPTAITDRSGCRRKVD
ncbi:beta-1,4-endoglucanase [Myxococcus stipitatus DSM 14675]|uniref:cellulase n=1 Tax=Myxococcus stipitatus (strain DSM 14675 / JCM 12634 / Mx s8) TaxID=1278073 RepID=L7U754_MYXSD|nr:endoglucanase [Myxococcus stipitatus]AGC43397.1 beta-1,4-endoglucanase [Myxococcus stipitatus DSM 14675]